MKQGWEAGAAVGGSALLKVGGVAAIDLGDLAIDLGALGGQVDPDGLLRLAQVAGDLGSVPPAGGADKGLTLDVQVHLCKEPHKECEHTHKRKDKL